MRLRSLAVVAAAAGLLGLALAGPARTASALSASDAAARVPAVSYPTWDEVQKAKSDAAASKAEYQKISDSLTALQSAEADAADALLSKQAVYTKAQKAVDAASVTATRLAGQAADAGVAAKQAEQQLAGLAAQQYRASGTSTTVQLLVGAAPPQQLLRTLGTLHQLTAQTAGVQTLASQQRAVASSLARQAAAAKKTLAKLSAVAQQALQQAQAAQQHAQAVVADAQARSDTLYAQAAELQSTSVALQKKYLEHQAYLAALAKKRAEEAASGGNTDKLYLISQGLTPDPAAAQAYAKSRLGAYGWNSDTQWQCLVQLWTIESGWRVNAYNPSSAAYGIPQAWPATKMAANGGDWMTNPKTQIDWGLDYIASSYSTPCGALHFETSHTPYWY